jgi:CHAT domain-containing protein/tetratricopeptide (TPR) repeat protein
VRELNREGSREYTSRRRAIAAVALAVLLRGSCPGSCQEPGEPALPDPSQFCQLKADLMARLSVGRPDAVPLAETVLGLTAQAFGPQHPEIVTAMTHVGLAHRLAGEVLDARSYFEVALRLAEELLGPEDPETAKVLDHLGRLLAQQGEIESAQPKLERAVEILERTRGPDSPEVAVALNDLGMLLYSMDDLAGARARLTHALEIIERVRGPDHVETATASGNLAMVLLKTGDLTAARQLAERALTVDARQFGFDHPAVAGDLNNLGRVRYEMGDLDEAARRFEQALAAYESTLPPRHPSLVAPLVNLGGVLNDLGMHEKAEEHLKRALEIESQAFGDGHPELACILGSLGAAAQARGEAEQAREYFQRAVEIRRLRGDREPFGLGTALNNRACGVLRGGAPESAIPELRQALDLAEHSLGPDHPDLATPLLNLAQALAAARQTQEAVELTERALDLEENGLVAMTEHGSLPEMETYLGRFDPGTSWALQLQRGSTTASAEAVRVGLTAVLRRKGRDLEAAARPPGVLDDPEAEELAAALGRTREALAFLELGEPTTLAEDRAPQRCRLSDRLRLLSAELRKARHRFEGPSVPITIEAVQGRIPERTALVEFSRFDPVATRFFHGGAVFSGPRYLAYVLRRKGEPGWVDLGDAETLDRLIGTLRNSLAERRDDVQQPARRLHEATMARLRPFLEGIDSLLISPDGALNLVPFAALVDETGTYLLERYEITYLSSGRDLLPDQFVPSREPSLVVGAPTLGADSSDDGVIPPGLTGFGQLAFPPLGGAAAEAKAVGDAFKLPPERVLTGAAAREAAVKQVHGPRILHLATHGFFLGDPTPQREPPAPCVGGPDSLDPLLRSAIVLSRAEGQPATAAEDGLLTAAEAMDLDLAGTEVVTLSACETGVGEARAGRGVYGLRRALVIAGARTQLTSLWRVEDRVTAAFMTSWYEQIEGGIPRGEALRRLQLATLRGEPLPATGVVIERGAEPLSAERPGDDRAGGSHHPFFWASFILVGDTGPLPDAGADRDSPAVEDPATSGQRLLEEALEAPDPILVLARARAAQRLYAQAGDAHGEGLSLSLVAAAEISLGEEEAARADSQRAGELLASVGDAVGALMVGLGEAETWRSVGERDAALAGIERALARLQEMAGDEGTVIDLSRLVSLPRSPYVSARGAGAGGTPPRRVETRPPPAPRSDGGVCDSGHPARAGPPARSPANPRPSAQLS